MSEQKAPGVSATTRSGGSSTNNTKTRGRSVQYQLNTKAKSISDADKRAKKSNVESIKEDVPQAKAPSLSTRSGAWELTVSCSISLPDGGSFHPFAISHPRVFSLARWSLLIHTAFHVPRATRVRVLLPFRSPLPLESLLLSFPPATKRFQFARLSLACSWIQQMFERIYSRPYKNRVSFRKAMKKAIELIEQAATKGIQVQIAGRIDGKEMFLAIHMASSNDTSLG
ncbi:ribosomal protein L10 [Tanacetum coccineum]